MNDRGLRPGEGPQGASVYEAGSSSWQRSPRQLLAEVLVEPLTLNLALDLEDLTRPPQIQRLRAEVAELRARLARELGLVLPRVGLRLDDQLLAGAYRVLVDGANAGEGRAPVRHSMVLAGDERVDAHPSAEHTFEPVFGLAVAWLPDSELETMTGLTPIPREQVVAGHLGEVARRHAPRLLTRDGLIDLLDTLRERHPAALEELDGGLLPVATLHAVLQQLLAEGLPIRNLRRILETLGSAQLECAPFEALVEGARLAARPRL